MTFASFSAAGEVDGARILARLLAVGFVLAVVGLFLLPWQQSIPGSGSVIAYARLDRPQSIEAPIEGRVVEWHVQEGDHVEAGQLLLELRDNDPDILDRIERERRALLAQREAAALSIIVGEAKITALEAAREAAMTQVALRREIGTDRQMAAERSLDAAIVARDTAILNLERQEKLHEKGLASTRALELARLEHRTYEADVARAEAALSAARREVKALTAGRSETAADTMVKIEDARSSVQKAASEQGKVDAELAKLDVRLARQRSMRIEAPRAGMIFRILVKQGGEMVKPGEPVATLVPDSQTRAVELWVSGRDAPLVTSGSHVRLQFEGWPAIQFVGWPSVAVGTFPATVAFVDATDDGMGRFRVVVVPENDQDWPEVKYLRQGVRANGWILLRQVSLGYELWRQFNGFPPSLTSPEGAQTQGDKS